MRYNEIKIKTNLLHFIMHSNNNIASYQNKKIIISRKREKEVEMYVMHECHAQVIVCGKYTKMRNSA